MTTRRLWHHRPWRRLALAAVVWAALIAQGALAAVPVAAEPVVSLGPDRGPCATRATLRGTGFPPGQPIRLTVATEPRSGRAFGLRPPAVGADGAFALEVDMAIYAGPCRPGSGVPVGTRFIFLVETDEGSPSRLGTLLATAVFTVTASPAASPTPAPPMPGLPNTGGGSAATGQAWSSAWGGLALLLLVVLGKAYAVRLQVRRG